MEQNKNNLLYEEFNDSIISLTKEIKLQNNFLFDLESGEITSFRGDHDYLSNFSPYKTIIKSPYDETWIFPTSEHAFQAFKTSDRKWFDKIRLSTTAKESKSLGKQCPAREDWYKVKDAVMYMVLMAKFSNTNPKILQKLINTYPIYLMEGNTWGDQYWGCTYSNTFNEWIGHNKLGHILMLVRYHRMVEQDFCKIHNDYNNALWNQNILWNTKDAQAV